VNDDVGRREGVVRIAQEVVGADAGHEAGVVADVGADPDAGAADVVDQRPLRRELLVVVDEEWAACDCVERALVEEQAAAQRRDVHGARMAE